MIGAYDVSSSKWLWQGIPMSRGEGMLEHIALDTNDFDDDTDVTEYRQYAVHQDWQSTVWALSNTAGAIVEQYVQDDPFGKTHTLNSSGTDIGDFASKVYHVKRMHGGLTEEVTGLYDFRDRWLAPESGNWLSRDPFGHIDGANMYQAFKGNPLRAMDYYGLFCNKSVTKKVALRKPSKGDKVANGAILFTAMQQLRKAESKYFSPAICNCCNIYVSIVVVPSEAAADAVLQPQNPDGVAGKQENGIPTNAGQSNYGDGAPSEQSSVPAFETWAGSSPATGSQWNVNGGDDVDGGGYGYWCGLEPLGGDGSEGPGIGLPTSGSSPANPTTGNAYSN